MESNEPKSWPFEQARKLYQHLNSRKDLNRCVLFETGYGPSGLPHMGTFGEVLRTSLIRRAFQELYPQIKTRLIAFSDDMDGLRKVPDNIPNAEKLQAHLGKPLTQVPDPFGTHDSFGAHNNDRLKAFLNQFGFGFEFRSATEAYRSGVFDQGLLSILRHYDEVMDIMLPTVGEERRKTYSPIMPLCPKTGHILQIPIISHDPEKGTVIWKDDDGQRVETSVLGGGAKLQWKPDWAMRWFVFGIDYEMYGKDLIPSARLSARIVRAMGGTPPLNFHYELFLDEQGQKISKSKGNGLTMEEWLRYGVTESLSWYMFGKPGTAKRLHFDIIPAAVDSYLADLRRAVEARDAGAKEALFDNPAWHVHAGTIPKRSLSVTFALMINLVNACNTENVGVLKGYIRRYGSADDLDSPLLDRLLEGAVAYYQDFVLPKKAYLLPDKTERAWLLRLRGELESMDDQTEAETIQDRLYALGRDWLGEQPDGSNLRGWFRFLYRALLGCDQGPRMGSFVRLYGVEATRDLIDKALGRGTASTTA